MKRKMNRSNIVIKEVTGASITPGSFTSFERKLDEKHNLLITKINTWRTDASASGL